MSRVVSVCAILTCFNRKQKTVESLLRLQTSAKQTNVQLWGVLVDDASRDGTAEAAALRFPWLTVLHSNGNLYWSRGMHMAMSHALAHRPADAYLWLNDDTELAPEALSVLLATLQQVRHEQGRDGLVVGSTRDPHTGQHTYGGSVALSRLRCFSYRKVFDAHRPMPCEAINGNVVLIAAAVAADVGNLDPVFEHAMGDTDYGLRALARHWPVVVAPGFVGNCGRNPIEGTFMDTRLSRRERWRRMLDRKGLPPRSWAHLCRRHGGPLWPLRFAWPYLQVLLTRQRPGG